MTSTVINGNVLDILKIFPDDTFHEIITSIPYYGLRKYGTDPVVWDGKDGCEHEFDKDNFCIHCGAWRGELGQEPTPELYVKHITDIFRELRRVLRKDGVCWLNVGDSYSGSGKGPTGHNGIGDQKERQGFADPGAKVPSGCKQKDLIGIPWLLAKALRDPYYTGKIKSERDRVWLAGIIDGEGSISATNHIRGDDGSPRTFVNFNITNTSLALLDEADRIWPANRHDHQNNGEGHLGKKQCYRWNVNGVDNQINLIREIFPHLIVKRKQAIVAYNLLLKIKIAKHMGHTPQKDSARKEREDLAILLQSLNADDGVSIPDRLEIPPTLYEHGWYLRSDIPWLKRNSMPSSVKDRPGSSIEHIFLLTKSAHYFYDHIATMQPSSESYNKDKRPRGVIRQCVNPNSKYPDEGQFKKQDHAGNNTYTGFNDRYVPNGFGLRYMRDSDFFFRTWQGLLHNEDGEPMALVVNPKGYKGAHFACFPVKLAEALVLAGTSEKGVCPSCGAPWVRQTKKLSTTAHDGQTDSKYETGSGANRMSLLRQAARERGEEYSTKIETTGWTPSCSCENNTPVPATVLDPFNGSGATGVACQWHNREYVGIDINPSYCRLSEKRLKENK